MLIGTPGAPRLFGREFGPLTRGLAAVVGAAALVVSFPPYGWWWSAPLGVAAIAVSTLGASRLMAAFIGALAGVTFFGGLLSWMQTVGVDAWIALTVLCAAWWVLLFVGQGLLQRLRLWPVLVPALWVAVEAARGSLPLGGFPWGRLVFSQVDSPVLPATAILGPAGITYIVALIGCLAAAMATAANRDRLTSSLAGGALLLGLLGVVIVADDRRSWSGADGPTIGVAVVQGGVPGSGLSAMSERRVVLDNHARLTTALGDQIAKSGDVLELVVWPESSTDIDPFTDASARRTIDDAVRAVGVPVLVGAVVQAPEDPERLANTGIVWDPVGGPGASYVKRHPVPFGEYIPLRERLGDLVDRFALVPRDFVSGQRAGVLNVGDTTVGDVICFEVAYDGIVRDVVEEGAQLIVVQTNNATYGGSAQLAQQFAMARVRAVEHGRTVLVAATSGISAIVMPDGSVASAIGDGDAGVITGRVPLREDLTLATRWASILERGLVAMSLVAIGLSLLSSARSRAVTRTTPTAPHGILRRGH